MENKTIDVTDIENLSDYDHNESGEQWYHATNFSLRSKKGYITK